MVVVVVASCTSCTSRSSTATKASALLFAAMVQLPVCTMASYCTVNTAMEQLCSAELRLALWQLKSDHRWEQRQGAGRRLEVQIRILRHPKTRNQSSSEGIEF